MKTTLTFFGQPKFSRSGANDLAIGYELFIREAHGDEWTLPHDFGAITAPTIERLLGQVLEVLPKTTSIVSFNLEQTQFIDPAFAAMVARVQVKTDIHIYTELTERQDPNVTARELFFAAQHFKQLGLLVCIDDVGTGFNTPELVLQLDPYIDEYKFALQNLRPFNTMGEVESELQFWYDLAATKHKKFAIEGIETEDELLTITEKFPCDILQGYYIGKPLLIPVGMT